MKDIKIINCKPAICACHACILEIDCLKCAEQCELLLCRPCTFLSHNEWMVKEYNNRLEWKK